MMSRQNFLQQLISTLFVGYALVCLMLLTGSPNTANGYPTEALNMFSSHKAKFEDKTPPSGDLSKQSFNEFINSKHDSTLIGEIKPNSSDQDLMLLKQKIASTILSMQEADKTSGHESLESAGADCYIEVTRVERVAGRCRKVNNGLPTCQSDDYIAINSDCS